MVQGWIWVILGAVAWVVTSCATGGAPQPKFTVSPAEGTAPLTVTCENQTPERYPLGLFAVRWQWSFGDGTPDSLERQPVHTYEQPGEYTVRLTASTPLGRREAVQAVRVIAPEPDGGDGEDGDNGGDGGGGDGGGDGGGGGGGDGGGGDTTIPPRFSRTFSVASCTPELPVEITLLLEYSGTAPLTALGLVETLPDGWAFEGVVAGQVDLVRQNGQDVEFAWITPPAFPASLTYRVRAPADLAGDQTFSGLLHYRFDAGGLTYGPVVSVLPAVPGDGNPTPSPDILLARAFSTGGVYIPGEPVTVTLSMTYTGLFPLSSLGIRETLPPGWTLEEVAGDCPPPVHRQNGQDAEFAWIDLPVLPCSFTYQVRPSTEASGLAAFSGIVLFRTVGGEQTSAPFVSVLSLVSPELPPDTGVAVPDVTGMPPEAAVSTLASAGLAAGFTLWEHREGVAAGLVSAQSPVPGVRVASGTAIALTVSLGPPPQPEADYASETVVNVRRNLLERYSPGNPVSLAVTFEKRGGRDISVLTLREVLPDGWFFAGVESGPDPAARPDDGASGGIAFTWLNPGTFPFTCVYRLIAPAAAAAWPAVRGGVQYETAGGRIGSSPVNETVPVRADGLETIAAARMAMATPECYTPGQPVSVTIEVSRAGGAALAALGATLYLPAGWNWNGITQGTPPPVIRPDGGLVEFAWITPPSLPLTFTASVTPPADTAATRGILACQAQSRSTIGGAVYGPPDHLVLPRLAGS